MERNSYLAHHGVKGQKWGVRRYQNDDGSLTALGKQRYGGQKVYKTTLFRKALAPELRDKYSTGKLAENIAGKRANKLQAKAKVEGTAKAKQKALNATQTYEAYKARNANRKAYAQRTSTGKLYVQNFLLTPAVAIGYRSERAAGKSFIEAFVGSPYLTNKEAYDRYILID